MIKAVAYSPAVTKIMPLLCRKLCLHGRAMVSSIFVVKYFHFSEWDCTLKIMNRVNFKYVGCNPVPNYSIKHMNKQLFIYFFLFTKIHFSTHVVFINELLKLLM